MFFQYLYIRLLLFLCLREDEPRRHSLEEHILALHALSIYF